jgi:hypothetical protein
MSRIVSPLIVTAALFACYRGVPAPDFKDPFDAATPDQIRDYVNNKLQFDTTEGPGDKQSLPVGCPAACRPGPVVAIQPEKRMHRNNQKSLAVGPGRIIARLINLDPVDSYPPLNLGPKDTVYWAVDQVKPSGRDASTGRSLYISAEGLRGKKTAVRSIPMHLKDHVTYDPWKQALARWKPVDSTYYGRKTPGGDDGATALIITYMTWGGCKSQSCCGP